MEQTEPVMSPQGELTAIQNNIQTMLGRIGDLRHAASDCELLSARGKSHVAVYLDVTRNQLIELFGLMQLILNRDEQTVADFGRPESTAPF